MFLKNLSQFKQNCFNKVNLNKICKLNNFIFLKEKGKEKFFWKKIITISLKNNFISDIYYNYNYNYLFNTNRLAVSELELKGINYWFCFNHNKLLVDYGKAHYKIFFFQKNLLLNLWKKKNKKLLFISNITNHYAVSYYFRYKLKPVGPYKLKGFQFFNELVTLKEGKKPFK